MQCKRQLKIPTQRTLGCDDDDEDTAAAHVSQFSRSICYTSDIAHMGMSVCLSVVFVRVKYPSDFMTS